MSIVDLVFEGKVCLTAGVRKAVWGVCVLGLAAGLVLAPASGARAEGDSSGAPGLSLEQIDKALLVTYWHGVTPEIAQREVGAQGVPRILEHLRNPDYPRRDNLVAFLHFLDGDGVFEGLASAFTSREFAMTIPEEDRARMMIPHALGMQALRGEHRALDLLMSISGGGQDRALLDQAASAYADSATARVDLMEDVLRGLALSGDESARDRLTDVGLGRLQNLPVGRDLAGPALDLIERMDEFKTRAPFSSSSSTGSADPGADGAGPDPQGESRYVEFGEGGSAGDAAHTEDFDTQGSVHENRLTYANHVDTPNKMVNSRLDEVLLNANQRAGRADYTGDVACCSTVVRSGNNGLFGFTGDGRDRIDNSTELTYVLTLGVSRVKVVRQINWCGGGGAGIIGCAYTPGNGMAVVRMTNLNTEAILWIHEYGHNTGLQHATQSIRIMYGADTGSNSGLSQSECTRYHFPSPSANALNSIVSTCVDNDGDSVHDWIDNCDADSNQSQYDGDGDGAGNACDNCPNLSNPDQMNSDGDTFGNACDDDDDNDGVPDGEDCAPTNPFASTAAGPPEDLGWIEASDSTMNWVKGQGATYSNIYRADVAMGTPAGWSCLQSNIFGTTHDDSDIPGPDQGYSYVISSENSCGEGDAGLDSNGQPRLPTPCP